MGMEDFTKDNCELSAPRDIFTGIFMMTNGKPCEGCSYSSNCQNYYTLNPKALRPTKAKSEMHQINIKRPRNKNRTAF